MTLRAWWYSPRDGQCQPPIEFAKPPTKTFAPPGLGEQLDRVLVLDDMARNYPAPGTRNSVAPDASVNHVRFRCTRDDGP